MLKFYYSMGPNPMKVALFLAETDLPHTAIPVDAMQGEQLATDYLQINPNGKLPAIVDGTVTVFDSNAILLYLAEKTGQFLPAAAPEARGQLLSWLLFIASGVGPFCGQAVHFKHHALEPNPYALRRYSFEAMRHYKILDARLAAQPYMLGASYTIVDMALWGWARAIPFVLGPDSWDELPHLRRLVEEISQRPAAVRAADMKHRFKSEMDEAARRQLFRHV